MLRPSAAPRWNITTSRLPLEFDSLVPNAARVRNVGIAAVPTTAIAPPFRNVRLVILITLAIAWEPQLCCSSSLKLRRSEQESHGGICGGLTGTALPAACGRADLAFDRLVRLRRNLAGKQYVLQLYLV